MNPTNLRETTAAHLESMDAAVRAAGITPEEPLAPVLAEWRRGLAWAGELTAQLGETAETLSEQMKAMVVDVKAAALSPVDPAALVRLEEAATTGADRRATKLAWAHLLRATVFGAGVLIGAVMMAGAGGYYLGRISRAATETEIATAALRDGPTAAANWLTIVRSNDVATVLKDCVAGKALVVVAGRKACGTGVWLDPVPQGAPAVLPASR